MVLYLFAHVKLIIYLAVVSLQVRSIKLFNIGQLKNSYNKIL